MPSNAQLSERQVKVLISYARKDGFEFAAVIKQLLNHRAPLVRAWVDVDELRESGENWRVLIDREIDAADYLLVILTPESIQSSEVRREWLRARRVGCCVRLVAPAGLAMARHAQPHWMRKAQQIEMDGPWEDLLLRQFMSPCGDDFAVRFSASRPDGYVPRVALEDRLLRALQADSEQEPRPLRAAVFGTGGFGKTSLCSAVAASDAVIRAYDDGVFFLRVGPGKDSTEVVRELSELVHVAYRPVDSDQTGLRQREAPSEQTLASLLADRNCLVVLDDVWDPDILDLVDRVAIPNTGSWLISTQNAQLATAFAGPNAIPIGELTADESITLLAGDLMPSSGERAILARIAEKIGHWPLPLALTRSNIQSEIERGAHLAGVLESVLAELDDSGITIRDHQQVNGHPASHERSVAVSVSRSLRSLREHRPDAAALLGRLTIFPEGVSIPEATIRTVEGARVCGPEGPLAELERRSLIRRERTEYGKSRAREILLHPRIAEVVANRFVRPDEARDAHARLVDACEDPQQWSEDGYMARWIGHHLAGADRLDELARRLVDFPWLYRRILEIGGTRVQIADCARIHGNDAIAALRVVLEAIAASMERDPSQLAGQLLLRIDAAKTPGLEVLLAGAREFADHPWIRPLRPWLAQDRDREDVGNRLFIKGLRAVALSANGDRLATLTETEIALWDRPTLERIHTIDCEHLGLKTLQLLAGDRFLVAWGGRGTILVWDLTNLASVRRLSGQTGHLTAVVPSPSGDRLASTASDGTAVIWSLSCAAEPRWLQDGRLRAYDATWLTESSIAVAHEDGVVRVWDLTEQRLLQQLDAGTGNVRALCSLDQGRLLVAAASEEKRARVWDPATGQEHEIRSTSFGKDEWIDALLPTEDGRQCLVITNLGNSKRTVWRWQPGGSSEAFAVLPAKDRESLDRYCFVRCRMALFTADQYGSELKRWDLASETGDVFTRLPGHIGSIAASSDGGHLAAFDILGELRLYDLADEAEGHKPEEPTDSPSEGRILGLLPLPDEDAFVILRHGRGLSRLEVSDGTERPWHPQLQARALWAVSPDGERVVATVERDDGTQGEVLVVWRLSDGAELCRMAGHTQQILDVSVDPAWRLVASVASDRDPYLLHGETVVWDLSSGVRIAVHPYDAIQRAVRDDPELARAAPWQRFFHTPDLALKERWRRIEALNLSARWSSGSDALVTRENAGGDIRAWSIPDLALNAYIPTPKSSPNIGWVSDQARLLALHPGTGKVIWPDGKVLRVWDQSGNGEISNLHGHQGDISMLVVSADGRRAATTGSFFDDEIAVWNLRKRSGRILSAVRDRAVGLAFLDGSRLLAVFYRSGTLCVLDATSGETLARLDIDTAGAEDLVASASGKCLALLQTFDVHAVALEAFSADANGGSPTRSERQTSEPTEAAASPEDSLIGEILRAALQSCGERRLERLDLLYPAAELAGTCQCK